MAVQFLWAQILVLWGSFSSAFVAVLGVDVRLALDPGECVGKHCD